MYRVDIYAFILSECIKLQMNKRAWISKNKLKELKNKTDYTLKMCSVFIFVERNVSVGANQTLRMPSQQ